MLKQEEADSIIAARMQSSASLLSWTWRGGGSMWVWNNSSACLNHRQAPYMAELQPLMPFGRLINNLPLELSLQRRGSHIIVQPKIRCWCPYKELFSWTGCYLRPNLNQHKVRQWEEGTVSFPHYGRLQNSEKEHSSLNNTPSYLCHSLHSHFRLWCLFKRGEK